jgi:hypothetical protein
MDNIIIKKVTNGYIIEDSIFTRVYNTLEEVFDHLLLQYEGRSETFRSDSYGKVTINRELK